MLPEETGGAVQQAHAVLMSSASTDIGSMAGSRIESHRDGQISRAKAIKILLRRNISKSFA